MLGYIPIAMAFGLLCKGQNISMLDSTLFSFVFYSGAAQFMAVELLGAGVGMFSIVLSVFLLNLRLFIMSTSLGIHTENVNPKALPAVGFMLTDEALFGVGNIYTGWIFNRTINAKISPNIT